MIFMANIDPVDGVESAPYSRGSFRMGKMTINRRIDIQAVVLLFAVLAAPVMTFAQTDETQVYDGGLAEKGKFNLTLHNNFTPKGLKEPAFPGAIISDKSLNGVPEWAYGVTKWFEAGLYLP